jgi:hypothetical protein
MADNPTIVVGHLNDKELKESIDSLVKHVDTQALKMAENFDAAIQLMRESLKSLSGVKIDITSSLDGLESAKKKLTSGSSSGGGSSASAPNTISELKEQISLQGKIVDEQVRGTAELQREVDLHAQLKNDLREETKSTQQRLQENAKAALKNTFSLPSSDMNSATAKLRALLQLQSNYTGKGIFSPEQWNGLQKEIDKTRQQIERLKSKMPKTITDVLGMDESSVDAISKKMQALKRVQIDPNNAAQVKQLGEEYTRLGKKQNEYLGKNLLIEKSNHALASTFGYIRNRIIYAFTIGALARFARDLASIRAEYEMLDRSLGILVGDFERGTQIFNELNQMALKSPFTLIELGTAAKQLTAYNFAADEVVDTTRRLADISAALGVPMERLTYNLGQIKAQGVLTARDARDFANAGLAIVPMLAKMYTEQKAFGDEAVTTAKVYDMMSKKMVTYSDVLRVLYQVTDEGGKFFDFQARQATTLKVQMANLTLAYNNMMNEIGKDNQGIMSGTIQSVRYLFENWRQVWRILQTVILTLGVYRTVSMLAVGSKAISAWISLARGITSAKDAMALFNLTTSASPIGLVATALAAVIGYFVLFKNNVESVSAEVEIFGESASKTLGKINTLQKILKGTDETSQTYKKTLSELSGIAKEYGVELDAEKARRDEINQATERTIQLIKEEATTRQRANQLQAAQEQYDSAVENARKKLKEGLLGATGGVSNQYRKQIRENAEVVTSIIDEIVTSNIDLLLNKDGKEYENGVNQIYELINRRLERLGFSGGRIQRIYSGVFSDVQAEEYIQSVVNANGKLERRKELIEENYEAGQREIESTMTFTQKVDANARALRNNTNDAVSLYNRVYDIVKLAKENHVINFDLKLSAEKPPKWMLDKSLPELQQLAERFTAIAQSGGHAKGYDRESTYERGLLYASAARIKQEEEERNARNKNDKDKKTHSDQIAKALKDEISLVKQLQGAYDTLTKKGDSHANAVAKVQEMYGGTIDLLNRNMDKFGLPHLDLSIIKGNNQNEVLAFFERVRDVLESKGLSNLERMESVEGVIKEFKLKADTYNLDMITKGLNNELGKLKEEYELAVEFDANPELGDVFSQMFKLDVSNYPKTIGEYMNRVQGEFDKIIKKLNLAQSLNIFTANTEQWYEWGKSVGYAEEQVDEFKKRFDGSIDVAKKWAQDVVKQTQDLQYKLADNNGKIAIEEEKLAQLRIRLANEVNKEQKKLLELQIQDQQNAVNKLKEEILQMLPTYQRLFGEVAEHSAYMTRRLAQKYKEMLKNARANPDGSYTVTDPINGKSATISKDRLGKELKNADKELRNTQSIVSKLKEAFTRGQDGVVDWVHGIELVGEESKKAAEGLHLISDMMTQMGASEESVEVVNDIASSLEGVSTASQGIAQFASGDYLGGTINTIKGLWQSISTWFDNSDKKISREVEKSEREVRRLELAYKDLEYEVNKAYGTSIVGAQAAANANKRLQLVELQRQLQLEESRKAKNRDENRIIDLQGQIKDLQYDIIDSGNEITNTLLGISSVGDAVENMVGSVVSALRNGDNAIDAFNGNIDDMIANLITKFVSTRMLGPIFQEAWDAINDDINKRAKPAEDRLAYLNEYKKQMESPGSPQFWLDFEENRAYWGVEALEKVEEEIAKAELLAKDASQVTKEDLQNYIQILEDLKLRGQDVSDFTKELLDKAGLSGNADKNLSALQQGIMGITEDTAGALEAYMNGVSQQVYLHSTLLTQIRDAVVAIDGEVQVGVQAQMLLQLQQSYAVQMAIQGILEGALNPSGRAFSVELIS